MGREAECMVVYDGKRARRKVLLETDEIIARGEPRVVVKRAEVTSAKVEGSALFLAWKGGTMVIALGAAMAEKWAHDILHPKSRLDKIGVKPGHRVSLVGVSDSALPGELAHVGADVLGASAKELDIVFVQADTAAALAKVEKARGRIAARGAVWVVTPRGVGGVKDVDVMRAAKAAGLVDVKVVRFSETHTALKFVMPVSKR